MDAQDIYEPAEDSYLLKEQVQSHAFGRVLDMGTGSGVQALSLVKSEKVKSVLAVDINPKAVSVLREKIASGELGELKYYSVLESDLFSNVEGLFDTIIFNAPYLPQDYIGGKAVVDPALYGGKQGWEILERFFLEVGDHLAYGGQILVLFSSLTDKGKVDEIIDLGMYSSELLIEKKLPMFETLYIYKVKANDVRNALQSRGVHSLKYFDKGRRGLVYTGRWDKNSFAKKFLASKEEVTVAVKVKNKESLAHGRIRNEIYWLRKCNAEGIGPKLYFYDKEYRYVVREFIEGKFFSDFLEEHAGDKAKVLGVLKDVLHQCFLLDKMKVTKDEFTRPLKNVMVNGGAKVVLLDFERCRNDEQPSNVSQFVSFLANQGYVDKEKAILLSQEYKKSYAEKEYSALVALLW